LPYSSWEHKKFAVRRYVRSSKKGRNALISKDSEASLLLRVVLVFSLRVIESFERFFAIKLGLGFFCFYAFPNFSGAVIAAAEDVLEVKINGYSLYKLLMLIKHFNMIFLIHIPDVKSFVHASRHNEFRVLGPTKVENVLGVSC